MGKTKTKTRTVEDSPKPPITIRSTNPKILDDNIAKLEKAIQAGDVSANPSGTAEETLLSTIGIDGKKYELGPSAENTSYDNTDSGLTATDTQGAIDEIQESIEDISRGKIEVTADGVKTYGALLDDMTVLMDFSKIRSTSTYIFNDSVRDYIFQIHFNRPNGNVQFSRVTIAGGDPTYTVRIENIRLDLSSSSAFELNGSTYTDNTSNVVPENNTLTLIY